MRNLKGKRILVTRPKNQAKETIARLRKAGAKVIHIPLIEIADPSDNFKSLDRAISQLEKYDWVIFTSQNGVEKFFHRLRHKPYAICHTPAKPKFAAVGPATASALRKHGIKKVIIPRKENYSAEGLVDVLKKYDFKDKRVLFPSAQKAREILPAWLKKQGARLNQVQAYRILTARDIDKSRLRKLVAGKRIDKIYFFSRSAKSVFLKVVGQKATFMPNFLEKPL